MTDPVKRLVYWTPRLLCIAFALFLGVFALDVFEESTGVWQTTVALLMHLVPTAVVLAILAVSWRWEWTGAFLFTALGILYVVTGWSRLHWSAHLVIGGPLVLIGALFLVSWRYREQLRPAR